MGFRNFTTCLNKNSDMQKDNFTANDEFLYWFSGFTDAIHPSPRFIREFSTKRDKSNLSLVVWGSNLTSLVVVGRLTKQTSLMMKLPPYRRSMIIGLLLSDGWLTIASKTSLNARLGFKQSLAKGDYVWFVFNELSHCCSSYPVLTKRY